MAREGINEKKLKAIKAYLPEQDLTAEESGDITAWLFMTQVNSALKDALG